VAYGYRDDAYFFLKIRAAFPGLGWRTFFFCQVQGANRRCAKETAGDRCPSPARDRQRCRAAACGGCQPPVQAIRQEQAGSV